MDDNRNILTSLQYLLADYFAQILMLNSPVTIPTVLAQNDVDVVLLDMNFSSGINNGNEGLYWLKEIRRIRPQAAVVLFTAYADIDLAVTGIKEGAADFIVKPWNNDKLIRTLVDAYSNKVCAKKREKKYASAKTEGNEAAMYWGNSPAITHWWRRSAPPMPIS